MIWNSASLPYWLEGHQGFLWVYSTAEETYSYRTLIASVNLGNPSVFCSFCDRIFHFSFPCRWCVAYKWGHRGVSSFYMVNSALISIRCCRDYIYRHQYLQDPGSPYSLWKQSFGSLLLKPMHQSLRKSSMIWEVADIQLSPTVLV